MIHRAKCFKKLFTTQLLQNYLSFRPESTLAHFRFMLEITMEYRNNFLENVCFEIHQIFIFFIEITIEWLTVHLSMCKIFVYYALCIK